MNGYMVDSGALQRRSIHDCETNLCSADRTDVTQSADNERNPATPDTTSNAGTTPVNLHVEDSGGDGRPVVLIHGRPLSAESWAKQVPALSGGGYRTLRHRQSVWRSVRIRGPAVLLKTDDNPGDGLEEADIEEMKSGLQSDSDGFYAVFAKNFYTADGELKVEQAEIDNWREMAAPGTTKAALDCIGAFARTDFRDDLKRVHVPTLVIHGGNDGIVPIEVSGERTNKTVQNAQYHVVDGGPYGITASHAGEFNTTLIGFLDGLS